MTSSAWTKTKRMFPRIIIDHKTEIISRSEFKKFFGFEVIPKKYLKRHRKFTLRDCDIARTFLYHRIAFDVSEDLMYFEVQSYGDDLYINLN